VKPDLVSRGSRITNVEKLNVRPDLVSGGSRITNAEKLNVRPDLVSRGSRIIIVDLRLTLYQQVKPKIMRTESCIERITVSILQTLYREGLLSLGKTTLASLINTENACMNAWRLWIVDCLNVCMWECMKTLNFWLFECMHVWMHENLKFLIVWMYACMNAYMNECVL